MARKVTDILLFHTVHNVNGRCPAKMYNSSVKLFCKRGKVPSTKLAERYCIRIVETSCTRSIVTHVLAVEQIVIL